MPLLSNIRWQSLFLFALAVALYANTLRHGFVMDDAVVITKNKWTQQGLSGIPKILTSDSFSGYLDGNTAANVLSGGRYRPLSLVCFSVLTQFWGNNSIVFHLFAVLLYAFNGVLLYRLVFNMNRSQANRQRALFLAWATALLFITHPVHTEVVANIKSCDEQLAFSFGLGALYSVLQAYDSRRRIWQTAAASFFSLACLAKEHAVAIAVLAPLLLWFFRAVSPGTALRHSAPLALALIVFLAVRGAALDWHFSGQMMHDPLNNPFLKSNGQQWVAYSLPERIATILYVLLQYLRLLGWPDPLTHDYYPFHISVQTLAQPAVWLSALSYAALAACALRALPRKSPLAFGILFYLLTLGVTANIFFPVGTFMAERFLFLPSTGFCFALAVLASPPALQLRFARTGVLAAAGIFSVLTFLRNPAWASNERLLRTDAAISPNSAKLRNGLGTLQLDAALQTPDQARRRVLLNEAETNLQRAVALHPSYYDALLAYGACVFYQQKFDASIDAYRRASRLNPNDPKAGAGLAFALRYGGDYYATERQNPHTAIRYLSEAWQLQPDTATAMHLAAQLQKTGNLAEAAAWMEKAVALAPNDARLLLAFSAACRAAGRTADAARRAAGKRPAAAGAVQKQ